MKIETILLFLLMNISLEIDMDEDYEYEENIENGCNKYFREAESSSCDCFTSEIDDYYDLECMDFVNITNEFKYFELRFKNCHVPVLKNNVFSGLFIKRLYINNCSLNKIEDAAFANIHELELLDLSHNLLTSFNDSVVRVASALLTLRLSHNPLQVLEIYRLLEQLPNLKELSLINTNIVQIPKLNNVGSNLQALYLSDNRIKSADIPNLYSLAMLKTLDLGNNELYDIICTGIEKLKNLKKLLLSDNLLEVIPEIKSKTLEKLDLSNNLIEHPPYFKLHDLPMLIQLDLYGNKLTVLNETSFCGLKHNKRRLFIVLANNEISTLAPCVFANFQEEVLVDLSGTMNDTTLKCDCGLFMMVSDKTLMKDVYCRLYTNESHWVVVNSNSDELTQACTQPQAFHCEDLCRKSPFQPLDEEVPMTTACRIVHEERCVSLFVIVVISIWLALIFL